MGTPSLPPPLPTPQWRLLANLQQSRAGLLLCTLGDVVHNGRNSDTVQGMETTGPSGPKEGGGEVEGFIMLPGAFWHQR